MFIRRADSLKQSDPELAERYGGYIEWNGSQVSSALRTFYLRTPESARELWDLCLAAGKNKKRRAEGGAEETGADRRLERVLFQPILPLLLCSASLRCF